MDQISRGIELWSQERPDLDTSGTEVVWRVLRLGALFWDAIDLAVAPFGLRPRSYTVLAALRTHGAPDYQLPARVLLQATYLTTGGLTGLLDRMVSSGLIERLPDPNDGRGILIKLTASGLDVIDRAAAEVTRLESSLASQLPEPQRGQFAECVRLYMRQLDRLVVA